MKSSGAAALLALSLGSCKSAPMPRIPVHIYAGDSSREAMVRMQDQEIIPASDPKFDTLAGLPYDDLQLIFETMMKCEKWKGGTPMQSADEFFQVYSEILRRSRR